MEELSPELRELIRKEARTQAKIYLRALFGVVFGAFSLGVAALYFGYIIGLIEKTTKNHVDDLDRRNVVFKNTSENIFNESIRNANNLSKAYGESLGELNTKKAQFDEIRQKIENLGSSIDKLVKDPEALNAINTLTKNLKNLNLDNNSIENLKRRIEIGTCAGPVWTEKPNTLTPKSGIVYDEKSVTFIKQFSETPVIVVSTKNVAAKAAPDQVVRVWIDVAEPTKTGFKCRFASGDFSTITDMQATWIAIGKD